MKTLSFSILIAAKNEQKHLKDTLNSCINQDYPKQKYEIIVIDDDSSDNTFNIAYSFSKKYKNIKVFKKNFSNISKAKNFAFKKAKNSIVLFIDAHVILEKNTLKKFNQYFLKYKNIDGICGTYFTNIETDKNFIRDIRRRTIFKKNSKPIYIDLKNFTTFSMAIGAIKAETFKKIKFPENFEKTIGEDTFFQLIAHKNGAVFRYQPDIKVLHIAQIDTKTLLKKAIFEVRAFINILKNLYKYKFNEKNIPYLPTFFQYNISLYILLFLSLIHVNKKLHFIFTVLFLIRLFIYLYDFMPLFKTKEYKIDKKVETFLYLVIKDTIQLVLTPIELIKDIFNKQKKLKHLIFYIKVLYYLEYNAIYKKFKNVKNKT